MSPLKAIVVVLFAACCAAWAQPPRHPALEEAVRRTGLRVEPFTEPARASREIRLRLQTGQGPQAPVAAELVQRSLRNAAPPRQRSAEISRDHLLILVLDRERTVRYWQIVLDPRLVRGEFPDAAGNLRKTEFYRADAEVEVSVPDAVDAAEIRILAPSWPAGELLLTPVASVALSGSGLQ